MMEMKLIPIAFMVSLGLTSVQPNSQQISGRDGGSKLDENFRNLFDSIRMNDMKETENYRNALEQEAVKERLAFDTMKEQLQATRQRSVQKQLRNSDDKIANIGGKSSVFKRGVEDFSGEIPDFDILDEAEKIQKEQRAVTLAPFEEPIQMCSGMKNHDVDSFIKDITHSFQDSCADFLNATENEYQHLYNIVLTLAGYRISFANENTTNVCVKSENTIFLMEFTVNSTGQKALARTDGYRRIVGDADDEWHQYKDVLCLGINHECSRVAEEPEKIQLSCDWAANLYSWNGSLTKEFTPGKITVPCTV